MKVIETPNMLLTIWRANREVYYFLHIENFGEGQGLPASAQAAPMT
jgi:hypothetical protein